MSSVVMYYLETSRCFWEALPPKDPEDVTIGGAVMGTQKRILLKMLFVSDAFVCLPRGQERGGGNPSLTRMTCNHYTTPDNCALLVISHYFVCLSGIICYMLIAPLPSLCEWSSILLH